MVQRSGFRVSLALQSRRNSCSNYAVLSIIGDLAFGKPFGMLERDAKDIVPIAQEDGTTIYAPAVQILNERGEYSSTMGSLPVWIRPYMRHFDPWFARGFKSVNNLAGVSFASNGRWMTAR